MKYIDLIISKWMLGGLIVAGLAMTSCNDNYSEAPINGVKFMRDTDVRLDVGASIKLAPGMKQTVSCTIIPDDITDPELTWASTSTNIAEVTQEGQKGVVTAKSVGTSIIQIAQSVASYETLKSFTVNVMPFATGIELSDFEMYEGSSKVLSDLVKVTPEDGYNEFDYESSDPSTLIYENGKMKALKGGVVMVTVKTKDGSDLKATATVTIHPTIPVESMEFIEGQGFAINETVKLSYTLVPNNATVEVLFWKSSNEKIASVTNEGVVTAHDYGTAEIIVTNTEDGTEVAKTTISVVKGKISDFGDNLSIYTLSQNGKGSIQNGKLVVTYAAGQKRADLVRGATYIDVDAYPILAIKINGTGKEKVWHNLDFKVDGGVAGGLNMVWANVLTANDGGRVYYANIAPMTYGGTSLQGKGPQKMSMFTIKTGTDGTPPKGYELYWMKTFKSMDDLNVYLTGEAAE